MTYADPNLRRIAARLHAGERLDLQDGIDCLTTPDLFGLGHLAGADKQRRYGRQVTADTLDLGDEGRRALQTLLERAGEKGLVASLPELDFIGA